MAVIGMGPPGTSGARIRRPPDVATATLACSLAATVPVATIALAAAHFGMAGGTAGSGEMEIAAARLITVWVAMLAPTCLPVVLARCRLGRPWHWLMAAAGCFAGSVIAAVLGLAGSEFFRAMDGEWTRRSGVVLPPTPGLVAVGLFVAAAGCVVAAAARPAGD